LQLEASAYPDLEYCKTDLIPSKGVLFLKFSKASSALFCLEVINERSTVRPKIGSVKKNLSPLRTAHEKPRKLTVRMCDIKMQNDEIPSAEAATITVTVGHSISFLTAASAEGFIRLGKVSSL
jgi:hypothetical protein